MRSLIYVPLVTRHAPQYKYPGEVPKPNQRNALPRLELVVRLSVEQKLERCNTTELRCRRPLVKSHGISDG